MKKKNILFICKHNIFRSRVAEEYLKKINKNVNVSSAGLIKGISLSESQRRAALKFGLNISYKPKNLGEKMLTEQDLVIVVANDIPKVIFENPLYKLKGKIIIWKIKDVSNLFSPSEKNSKEIIERIIKKVDELNKKLKKGK